LFEDFAFGNFQNQFREVFVLKMKNGFFVFKSEAIFESEKINVRQFEVVFGRGFYFVEDAAEIIR